MYRFVKSVTGGWDGSEEDFLSDLYKIHKAWASGFKGERVNYRAYAREMELVKEFNYTYDVLPTGDKYLKVVILNQGKRDLHFSLPFLSKKEACASILPQFY